jgi:hypothetical protein
MKNGFCHPSIAVMMIHRESMINCFLPFLVLAEAVGSSCMPNHQDIKPFIGSIRIAKKANSKSLLVLLPTRKPLTRNCCSGRSGVKHGCFVKIIDVTVIIYRIETEKESTF